MKLKVRLTATDQWVSDVLFWVLVKEGFTFLTVAPHRVVHAVVTNPAAHSPRRLVHRRVKVTPGGVTVALAFCKHKSETTFTYAEICWQ